MIRAAMKKIRGFNTFEGIRAMTFLIGEKLVLDVPDSF